MQAEGRWGLFASHGFMSLTMVMGSFIAGATSEGGGAVAFPVMTLFYGIAPATARDFSLLIQSVGMSAATIAILTTRAPVAWRCLLPVSFGGAVGMAVGLQVAPWVAPAVVKMAFVSAWAAFGVALIRAYRERDAPRFQYLPDLSGAQHMGWIAVGLVGGVGSSLTGSGLDLLTFSVLVLQFRVEERVATPTSVVLMAGNAIVGVTLQTVTGATNPEAWAYWWVSVPVVVVGAPLGAWFIQSRSRGFIVALLLVSVAVQFIAACLLVPQSVWSVTVATTVFFSGGLGFALLGRNPTQRAFEPTM